ncbi:hypothetical protein GTQ40_05295 [Flavobacteriaceae bacterium R38]|nr:hypothetical protein [Flavobacteriaceae bacterium R38]
MIILVFWGLAIFFGYQIFQSINLPIKFDKIKKERYAVAIEQLKDVRDAQEAHRSVTGKFADDFESLIKFVDTAQFVITQQRDSSYLEYSQVYKIDELKEVKIIDTLGFKSVKDSLFGSSDRYKNMAIIPFAQNNEKIDLQADILDKNGYKAAVFIAKIRKDLILWDQPKDLLAQENEQISVDEVNGTDIILGSLSDVSTNGNWPPLYDTKKKN